jgi:hypothetical protein
MKRRRIVLTILLACFGMSNGSAAVKVASRTLAVCDLMGNVTNYHRQRVRVRAILSQGAEQSVVYDPACRVKEAFVAVEFPPRVRGRVKKLDSLVASDRRAWVGSRRDVLRAEPVSVDPKLPGWMRERLEGSTRRYGHLNSFETMMQIERVFQVDRVAPETAW